MRLDARTEDGQPVDGRTSFGRRAVSTGHALLEQVMHAAKPDGSRVWVSVNYQPLTGPDGTSDGLVLSLRDITEQHEQKQQLLADLDDAPTLARIYEALENDRLVLYSQPIFNLTSRATEQAEILVRMTDTDGDLIAPADFLPVAERHQAIVDIDCWVIRHAVALAADGRHLAINLSARSFGDPRVLSTLAQALRDTAVDPAQLVIEITETALSGNQEGVVRFAEQLASLGCGFALDDFGTGYGTLTYLKHLPITYIKIDREFIADLTTNASSRKVVSAITGIAREFGLRTIAEGIEDEQTLVALQNLGVELAQGFYLARPAPAVA